MEDASKSNLQAGTNSNRTEITAPVDLEGKFQFGSNLNSPNSDARVVQLDKSTKSNKNERV